jgi:gentisate 1,2-dioxygenase
VTPIDMREEIPVTQSDGQSLYEMLVETRNRQRTERQTARAIVKGKDIPFETNRHGVMQWYVHPAIHDTAIRSQLVYVQHLPPEGKSGRQHHPGGALFYFWTGHGHTVVDGDRHDWVAGELVQLPLKTNGTTYQHFNDSADEEARILAVETNYVDSLGVERGTTWEEIENAPEWNAPAGGP